MSEQTGGSVKVRARVKAKEYLPAVATCCPESTAAHLALGEFVVDLDSSHSFPDECKFCGAHIRAAMAVEIVGGPFIDLDAIDLDEGPMEAGMISFTVPLVTQEEM